MTDDAKPLILCVDNDAAGRSATTRTLRQAGFDVLEAATGAEALQLAGTPPDLNADTLDGLGGNDTLDGGGGIDRANLSRLTTGIQMNLGTGFNNLAISSFLETRIWWEATATTT